MMKRGSFTTAIGLAASAVAVSSSAALAQPGTTAAPENPAPFRIGMILFPNMTHLDFAGPSDAFARVRAAKVYVLAKTLDPITTDTGTRVLADLTLRDAPQLDLLFIGGGPGTTPLMEDAEILDFLRGQAVHAKWITSVCTGALVLGAAGLLRGYNAATHWTAMDVLPILGATPVHQRVVIDRNRITGGGVTAGIDYGLTVIGRIWGTELAELIQLGSEYNPQPPFNAGSPLTAPAAVVSRFQQLMSKESAARLAAAKRIAQTFS
jgi:cyclohexyl-isocyanide hydratase